MSLRVFISYRREDSAGHTGRLYDRLSERFGASQIFHDMDTIQPGVDFAEVIEEAVASSDVLIAVIGKQWLTLRDSDGRRRLDNPEDFIRLEIASALKRNIRTIPVLVEGVAMPRSDELPEPLTMLARRNALELSDARWQYDVGRLIKTLEQILGDRDPVGALSAESSPAGDRKVVEPAVAPAKSSSVLVPGRNRRAVWTLGAMVALTLVLGLSRAMGFWPDQRTATTEAGAVSPTVGSLAASIARTAASTPDPPSTSADLATDVPQPVVEATPASAAESTPASTERILETPQPATTDNATGPAPAGTETPAETQQAAEAAPAPEPAGRLVFDDDLNGDKNKSGLADLVRATDFSRGFHPPGVYHFKLPQPNETHWVVLPRLAFADFSFQMDLQDNSDSFAGSVAHGIIFRVRDNQHFYAVLVDSRKGQYAIRKVDGQDTWSDLIAWKASPLIKPQTETNQLRVDAAGDTFTIYLNGETLDSFSDGAYPFGMLGIIMANVDAVEPHSHFDNLKIWSDDSPPQVVELPPVREHPAGSMVLIPGGEFIMGGNEKRDEQAHLVGVPDFYIDRTEVTNAAYRQCIAAGKCTPQQSPASETHPNYASQPEFDSFPVLHVSWQQAQNFCGWVGKRLPNEAEWEKAASWNGATREKLTWPWDNVFDPARLNSSEAIIGDTTPVDEFPPELNGTLGMAGNVSEWTTSLYQPYPYDAADGREDPQAVGERVFRGGSWAQSKGKARGIVRQPGAPTYISREIGFRCAIAP